MIKNTLSEIKKLFRRRRTAYNFVFIERDPNTQIVLEDLARFCRAHESTFTKDERLSAVLEGRREVWLRIQNFLNLSEDQLYKLHHVKGEESVSNT